MILLLLTPAGRAELFVSSYHLNQVFRYHETNGAFLDVFIPNTNGLLDLPHGLAFGPDGNLYVASAGNDCILRYNGTNGDPVDVFVTNSPALDGPSDMVFGLDENLYVVGRFNNRVVRYNGSDGSLLGVFATDNLSQPFGLRFDAEGNLLVLSGNNHSVQRFDGENGAFLNTLIASGNGDLNFPIGAVFGPDGSLYVASFNNHKIARFNPTNGVYLGDFVPAASSGGLSGPNFMRFRPSAVELSPSLNLMLVGTNVVLTWPTNATGFQVQEAAALSANPDWITLTNTVTTTNASHRLTLPRAIADRFYRLVRP